MNIFVGNLEYTATEDEVRQLFEGYGTVNTVNVSMDRDTGRPRRLWLCRDAEYHQSSRGDCRLNGTMLGGRALTINEARPREERGGPRRAPGGKRVRDA